MSALPFSTLFGRQGGPRHVSGSIAGLGAGQTATLVFDLAGDAGAALVSSGYSLGAEVTTVQVSVSAPGATGTCSVAAGSTPTPATDCPCADLLTSGLASGLPLVSGQCVSLTPVMGRYLYVTVTNSGAGAFTALATVSIAAFV